jgi:hypothetical protein
VAGGVAAEAGEGGAVLQHIQPLAVEAYDAAGRHLAPDQAALDEVCPAAFTQSASAGCAARALSNSAPLPAVLARPPLR